MFFLQQMCTLECNNNDKILEKGTVRHFDLLIVFLVC
jgi:hypothetical protein